MRLRFSKPIMRLAATLVFALSAEATTVSMTFLGAPAGVSDGSYYVLPYQLSIDGITSVATCYDIFHSVSVGQSWIANEFTVNEAAATGMFSWNPDALTGYRKIGFLSQQATSSAQNQVDLQHAIWNVFAPGTYSVTPGMQAYLDLLSTPVYSTFDFNTVRFLEDVNQTNRVQAFVVDPPTHSPEPGTVLLSATGAMIIGFAIRRKQRLS